MMRPLNLILAIISVMISFQILDFPMCNPLAIHVFLTVGLFHSGSNILNDIIDVRTDKVNRPDKPLPLGKISPSRASIAAALFFISGILAAIHVQPYGTDLVIFIILPILVLYTPIFKGIPLLGNLMIGASLGFVFLFTEAALTNQIYQMLFPAFLAFHLTFNRELVKDLEDLAGDTRADILTFSVWKGIGWTIMLILISSLLLAIWPTYAIHLGAGGGTSLIIFIFGFLPIFSVPNFYLIWKRQNVNFKLLSNMLKTSIMAGMAVIYSIPY